MASDIESVISLDSTALVEDVLVEPISVSEALYPGGFSNHDSKAVGQKVYFQGLF